jgi:putative NIF3 family GTP cyclohydrolase 1 type 2
MTTIKEYYAFLDSRFPFGTQDNWDNSGLQIAPDFDLEITGVVLATDITLNTIEACIEAGANVLLTHHPLVLQRNGLLSVSELAPGHSSGFVGVHSDEIPTANGILAAKLIKSGISSIAMHTNLDKLDGGVASSVAQILGLFDNPKPVISEGSDPRSNLDYGHGRWGALQKPQSLQEFTEHLRDVLSLADGFVRLSRLSLSHSDQQRSINTVAVLPGSGASMLGDVLKLRSDEGGLIDAIVTCDIKHHELSDFNTVATTLAAQLDCEPPVLIDVPHSTLENVVFKDTRKFQMNDEFKVLNLTAPDLCNPFVLSPPPS